MLASMLAAEGHAQTAAAVKAANPQATSTDGGLEDIVVTAERRGENLQRVPIAVTAITANEAAKLGINSTTALQNAVPGLTMTRQLNSLTPFLRGVGSTNGGIGAESPVALYVDDVYVVGGQGSLFEFNNIQQVEVLRGPQGTLFGRNATGGVVTVKTRDPEHTSKADLSLGYGNYRTGELNFYGTTGLTDTLAVNVAVHLAKQANGWGRSIVNGEDVGLFHDYGVRGKVSWEPTDTTKLLLIADSTWTRSDQGMNLRPVAGTLAFGGYGNPGFYNAETNHNLDPVRYPQYGYTSTYRKDYSSDYYLYHSRGVSLKLDQDLDFARLRSVTAYRKSTGVFHADQDGTPAFATRSDLFISTKTFTEEVHLLSPDDSSRLTWIVGAFYLHDRSGYTPYFNVSPARPNDFFTVYGIQNTSSYSGFGQATYEIFDQTHLTLGARYTRDKRRAFTYGFRTNAAGSYIDLDPGPGIIYAVTPTVSREKAFPKVTYRAGIDHRFTPDIMAYASFNRGFKSGVFNLLVPSTPRLAPGGGGTCAPNGPDSVELTPATAQVCGLALARPAAPEVLDAYEVGLKTQTLNGALRFNAAAFWYDYTNLQFQLYNAGLVTVANAGAARIKGLELEAVAAPTRQLNIRAALSFLDGKYTKFPGGVASYFPGGQPAGCVFVSAGSPLSNYSCNFKGNRTINTPKMSANLGAQYTINTSFGDFELAAQYARTSHFYFDISNQFKQPITDIVNGSITFRTADHRFDVRLWSRNLLGEKYYAYAVQQSLGRVYSPAAPFTFGLTVSAHLGS